MVTIIIAQFYTENISQATDFNTVRVDKLLPFDWPFPLSSHTPKLYFRSNFSGSWSSKGCSVVNRTKTEITCTCNHLTNFAVLMHVGADNKVSWSSFLACFPHVRIQQQSASKNQDFKNRLGNLVPRVL